MNEEREKWKRWTSLSEEIENEIGPYLKETDRIAEINQYRVLKAFRAHQVNESHLIPSTGYGYDDLGRETLERVFADCFGAEAALVRPQFISGTHAIATALFGVLRPGDELLYITGNPYDTLEEVIGIRGQGNGSLKDFGISYRPVPLGKDGRPDREAIRAAIGPRTKVAAIQRSRGYADRPSFSISDIRDMIGWVKEKTRIASCLLTIVTENLSKKENPAMSERIWYAAPSLKIPAGVWQRPAVILPAKKNWWNYAPIVYPHPALALRGEQLCILCPTCTRGCSSHPMLLPRP